jgi:hypothetical protein
MASGISAQSNKAKTAARYFLAAVFLITGTCFPGTNLPLGSDPSSSEPSGLPTRTAPMQRPTKEHFLKNAPDLPFRFRVQPQ